MNYPIPGLLTPTSQVSSWVPAMVVMILNGCDPLYCTSEKSTVKNEIGTDHYGNIVLYRQLTDKDRECIPELRTASEIWITFDFPNFIEE